jgi:hypothetical protein
VKLARFRKPKVTCFLSLWKTDPKYIQNMFPKVDLLEETEGGRKKEKNDSE